MAAVQPDILLPVAKPIEAPDLDRMCRVGNIEYTEAPIVASDTCGISVYCNSSAFSRYVSPDLDRIGWVGYRDNPQADIRAPVNIHARNVRVIAADGHGGDYVRSTAPSHLNRIGRIGYRDDPQRSSRVAGVSDVCKVPDYIQTSGEDRRAAAPDLDRMYRVGNRQDYEIVLPRDIEVVIPDEHAPALESSVVPA